MRYAIHSGAALLALFMAHPAAAQSSVKIYGLLDLGIGRYTGSITGVKSTDGTSVQLTSGVMSLSHIGFSAAEDLGGGFETFFNLSTYIRADTGAVGRSDALGPPVNVAADPFFSRFSFVGLRHLNWGTVRLGNAVTPMSVASSTTNAFGNSTQFSPLYLTTFVGGPLTGGNTWANGIYYDTPNWGGFYFTLAAGLSEGQGGGNLGGRFVYSDGPLLISLAGQQVKRNPITFADGTSPNDTDAWQVAVTYDFGVVRLFAHLGDIKKKGTSSAPLDIDYRITEVSAAIPLGAGNALVGYARRKAIDKVAPQASALAGGNVDREIASVGYEYFLSKRTDLYAVFMKDKTTTNTLPVPGREIVAKGNNFGVGIRHRF